ncbi:hypothetical protein RHSIM_Rhsim08G0012100 [Rhododendron simsii]|uniref:Endonuclease/exonuclease/phosphatase domain-containing protein n=1 Tax=Rhododendron simsii TaxID=118357 RepID=A0A834LE57_RHOSS|nr:hypothetical protein RHSIM_Rhsim08G0012100 [Rhododendron simsii]
MGDFNEVLSTSDKWGGNIPTRNRLSSFHSMLDDCGLVDLEFKGPKFTWRNNRTDGSLIMERIDMAFANAKWRETFDQAMVFVEAAVGSDHNPLILNTSFPLNKVGKPFRFESFWTSESSCKPVIMEAWAHTYEESEMGRVCKKLKNCKAKLKDWHRLNFGNLRFQITVLKDQLADVQRKLDHGFNSELVTAEKGISKKLEDLWQKDAMYWHQRSRIKWLQLGDKNSRFFHLSTIHRRQRNQISKLKDAHGVWQTETKAIAGIIRDHFHSLYCSPPTRNFDDVIDLVDPLVTDEINCALFKTVTRCLPPAVEVLVSKDVNRS